MVSVMRAAWSTGDCRFLRREDEVGFFRSCCCLMAATRSFKRFQSTCTSMAADRLQIGQLWGCRTR